MKDNKTRILLITGLLILFWILAIYSVSIYESFQLTLKLVDSWTLDQPSNYFYFYRHILKNFWIWLIFALLLYKVPLGFLEKYKNKIFIFALIIQLLVFTPLWTEFNWSRWWLIIPGFGTLQPSELFKIAFVVFISWWLLKKKNILNDINGFIWFLIVIWIFFLVFLKIPDLGTLMVLWPVALIMYWFISGKFRYVIAFLILWLIWWLTIWRQFEYIKTRLDYFINPAIDTSWRWAWWQIQQSLISVWWWWFWGQWYGKWLQKFWYIPEAQSDFVFAAFSEELGFVWNMVLISLYFFLAYFFLKKLPDIKNQYNRMLWVWLISLIMIQAFVNIWVNIKILPLTWITLPFISFGWTALMVNLFEVVLMYKILKESK